MVSKYDIDNLVFNVFVDVESLNHIVFEEDILKIWNKYKNYAIFKIKTIENMKKYIKKFKNRKNVINLIKDISYNPVPKHGRKKWIKDTKANIESVFSLEELENFYELCENFEKICEDFDCYLPSIELSEDTNLSHLFYLIYYMKYDKGCINKDEFSYFWCISSDEESEESEESS